MKATRSTTPDQQMRPLTGNRPKSNFVSGKNSRRLSRCSFFRTFRAGLIAAALGLAIPALPAAEIAVNSASDPDGFNPAITIAQLGATVTLRDAVNAANNTPGDDTILFDPALAGQTISLQHLQGPNTALPVTSNITILGPVGGVILSCSLVQMRHFSVAAGVQLALTDLTLRDGHVADDGGSILTLGTLTTDRVTFNANRSDNPDPNFSVLGRGAAVSVGATGVLNANFSTFSGNSSQSGGGAIHNSNPAPGAVTLTRCDVTGNSSTGYILGGNSDTSFGFGGGIHNTGWMLVTGTRLSGNTGNIEGGAIYTTGDLTVSDCSVESNQLGGTGQWRGVGISNHGTLLVSGTTFLANQNSGPGTRGGGVAGVGGTTRIVNSTFRSNIANAGSVAAFNGGTGVMQFCTASDNGVSGHLAIVVAEGGANVTIQNTILWNPGAGGIEIGNFGASLTTPNNVVRGSSGDPQLLPFTTGNGGPPIGLSGVPAGTYALRSSSSAFDTGVPIADIPTDQRGVSRPQGNGVDIGAFESESSAPFIASADQAEFALGESGSFNVIALGNPSSTFTHTGSLPAGVTLSSGGHLSGVPAPGTYGVYPITITASNGIPPDATQNFTLSVVEARSLTVNTTSDVVDNSDDLTSLNEAIIYANSLSGAQTITIPAGLGQITLTRDLAILTNPDGITINGNGNTIDGGSTSNTNGFRAFFFGVAPGEAAAATGFGSLVATTGTSWAIHDLTIQNANARGGHGGGGGAGLGGAVFVNAGHLSVSGVSFSNNRAVGGNGDNASRGGGGMGGNGGWYRFGGGGGGFGTGADGGSEGPSGAGFAGNYLGAARGGDFQGGANGGGGALAAGGGVGGGWSFGGDGGFGGGGGGAYGGIPGGRGGYGGGGAFGGAGGFGGGGGVGATYGAGGFGGGDAGNFGGGGGLGAGGAVFVRQGATFTMLDGSVSGGIAQGGIGSEFGGSIGSGFFLAGSATYVVSSGNRVVLIDSIGGGVDPLITGGFTKSGSGTLCLIGQNSFTGGTDVQAGVLELESGGSIGDVTVRNTAKFGGSGFAGAVVVENGATVYPGLELLPGILQTSAVTFSPGSRFTVNLFNTTAGGYDQLIATGDITLGDAILSVTSRPTIAPGESFPIVQAGGQLSGTFQGLPNGTVFSMEGRRFSIAYNTQTAVITRLIDDFTRQQDDEPFDLFATTGQPSGTGAFSGPGVTGSTFSPMAVGAGLHTLTFTPNSGSPVTFVITVEETPGLVVTTANDSVSATDGLTSLREAVAFANEAETAVTITFAPALAGQTLVLTGGQLVLEENVPTSHTTILGPVGGVTISGDHVTRPFQVNTGVSAVFDGLTIANGYADQGGGIVNGGNLTVRNCVLRQNVADENAGPSGGVGGAIVNYGTLTVESTLFELNSAENGAAINSTGQLTVSNSTFSDNSADFNGGALRLFGTAHVTGSTFNDNHAENGGGGLISHGDLTLINSTFTGNTAFDGAGLQAFEGTLDAKHVTIAGNTADRSGGGVVVNSATATLVNSIVAENAAPDQADLWGSLDPSSQANLIGVANPGLATLADNGGATRTIGLVAGSPAINSGVVVSGLTTDQRGLTRIVGGAADIGAFELQVDPPQIVQHPANQAVPLGGTATFSALAAGLFTGEAPSSLTGGEALLPEQFLLSPNRGFKLLYQTDGNLVIYRGIGGALWSSGTAGQTPGQAVMQGDGNFVIYGPGGEPQFASDTSGNAGALLQMQDDGNLVIYAAGGGAIFATDTATVLENPTPAMQWQVSADGGASFTNIPGATGLTLTVPNVSVADDQKQYRAVFTTAAGTVPTTAGVLTVITPLPAWRTIHGLAGNGSEDLENPSGDGVVNLLKYAFNMAPNPGDLAHPNVGILPEHGIAGLPRITRDASGHLVFEFVRRKAATIPGISYSVDTCDDLNNFQPLDLTAASVVSIDADWERVTVIDPTITPVRFGRVSVSAAP